MVKVSTRVWIVVADGARARFLHPGGDPVGLISALPADMADPDVHGHSRDLKSDKPGRSFSTAGGGARHAVESHHDFHKFEKHKFTAEVVQRLAKADAEGQFDHFVLVAPKRSLGEFRTLLPASLAGKLSLEVPKDMTKHSNHELWELLAPQLRLLPN